MSSPSKGPYKSRLFNFINRQYIRSRDRLGIAGRQIKSVATWGVQILLYPVYLIAQAGRMAGRQIGTKVERVQANLPSGEGDETPDQPLEAVLKTVEPWLSPQKNSEDFEATLSDKVSSEEIEESSTPSLKEFTQIKATESTEEKIIIQGVASVLATKKLVLVTTDNQIINILSEEQQKKLQQAISWETANFGREQRLNQKSGRRLPKITTNNPHLLLPVQLFWEVMSWMEKSPVAIAIDMFGEADLVPSTGGYLSLAINSQLPATGFLATIDNTIADIEQQDLSPQKTADKIKALIKAAVDYFFNKPGQQSQLPGSSKKQISAADDSLTLPEGELGKQPFSQQLSGKTDDAYPRLPQSRNKPVTQGRILIQRIGDRLLVLLQKNPLRRRGKSNTGQPTAQPDPFEIQFLIKQLIQGAIEYFFGENQGKLPPRGKNQDDSSFLPETELNTQQLLPGALPDPWLSWEDLYGEETPVVEDENPIYDKKLSSGSSVRNIELPQGPKTPLAPEKSRRGIFKQKLSNAGKSGGLRKNKPEVKDVVKAQKSPDELVQMPENQVSVTPNPPVEMIEESAEEFIETEASQVGYEQHFLEKILMWLDRAMLWIEELLAKIWRRLRGR